MADPNDWPDDDERERVLLMVRATLPKSAKQLAIDYATAAAKTAHAMGRAYGRAENSEAEQRLGYERGFRHGANAMAKRIHDQLSAALAKANAELDTLRSRAASASGQVGALDEAIKSVQNHLPAEK